MKRVLLLSVFFFCRPRRAHSLFGGAGGGTYRPAGGAIGHKTHAGGVFFVPLLRGAAKCIKFCAHCQTILSDFKLCKGVVWRRRFAGIVRGAVFC
ncbi:hypothetical protein HMPREF9120_01352 [Neisseria sp. oral taxon 020 str. F0370]|nr:hypothetical protein HMPREF9120_01352 [Neisseria sp. oral taxon 020 str. F0370]